MDRQFSSQGSDGTRFPWLRLVWMLGTIFGVAALLYIAGAMLVSASNHEWGSGKTYQECTDQGLTNYGRVTGRKWIGNFYANLYNCTTPTTTTTRATTTTTRKPNWGSGTPYKECTQKGWTDYGRRTGQKWINGAYKDLYQCKAPVTTTTTTQPTTTRQPDWGSGTPYKECTQKGWTDYGRRTGQKWINGAYKDLYQCKACHNHYHDPADYDYDSAAGLGFGDAV